MTDFEDRNGIYRLYVRCGIRRPTKAVKQTRTVLSLPSSVFVSDLDTARRREIRDLRPAAVPQAAGLLVWPKAVWERFGCFELMTKPRAMQ